MALVDELCFSKVRVSSVIVFKGVVMSSVKGCYEKGTCSGISWRVSAVIGEEVFAELTVFLTNMQDE